MCGIAGVVGDTALHAELPTMLSRIAHRGPDGDGIWRTQGVSFAHARLSIIDTSDAGAQPMRDPETGNVIVYNGEIYNNVELRDELARDYPFASHCDTEAILAAYRRWGRDCLEHLRGMFAFALWDEERQEVFLARDRVGIKPLYYREGSGYFLFASEIKALLEIGGLTHSMNEEAAVEFMAARHLDTGAHTMFNEVRQLLPATACVVKADGNRGGEFRYWSPPAVGERAFDEDAYRELYDFYDDTVRLHLQSDVPIGSFVSGGLDSSSVACLASQRLEPGSLHTFSMMLEDPNEENALIPLVQRYVGGVDHELHLGGESFFDDLPEVIYHHDEPIPDGSMFAHYELCRLAREAGIPVVLSGSGGDEVFGGYPSHVYSLLGRFLKRAQLAKLLREISALTANRHESTAHFLARSLQEILPLGLRNHIKRRQAVGSLSHTELQPAIGSYDFSIVQDADPYRANYLHNLCHWSVPPFLHYEDRNSMAFGVEARVPLLDHRMVEFVAQFDPAALLAGRSKSAMRRMLRGHVPDPILDQKGKYGFPAPLTLYIERNTGSLAKLFPELVKDVPFLRLRDCRALCDEVLGGNKTRWETFWRTISIATWYKIFFSNELRPWR